ncbi:MAG: hypothetical protein EB060_03015 [Proteobacteria bacterium]|nr:hypothetical protein [Pseudomonadota bacterium]
MNLKSNQIITTLSLFTSFSTLFCCALPALFVALGMGAVVAGVVSNVPQLIWLSEHKIGLFSVAALLLIAAGFMTWKNRYAPCPTDPVQAKACTRLRKINAWIYGISVTLYMIGFFFAFIAAKLVS